eukprot:bmy_07509T0
MASDIPGSVTLPVAPMAATGQVRMAGAMPARGGKRRSGMDFDDEDGEGPSKFSSYERKFGNMEKKGKDHSISLSKMPICTQFTYGRACLDIPPPLPHQSIPNSWLLMHLKTYPRLRVPFSVFSRMMSVLSPGPMASPSLLIPTAVTLGWVPFTRVVGVDRAPLPQIQEEHASCSYSWASWHLQVHRKSCHLRRFPPRELCLPSYPIRLGEKDREGGARFDLE